MIWLFVERGASGGTYEALPALPINVANVAAATALSFFTITGF